MMENEYLKSLIIDAGVIKSKFVEPDKYGKLPEGDIIKRKGWHYQLFYHGLTEQELNTAILAKQAVYLRTIKNILMFYFIMSIIVSVFAIIKISIL